MADVQKAQERLERIVKGYRHGGGFKTRPIAPSSDDPDYRLDNLEDAVSDLATLVQELLSRSEAKQAD